MNLQSHYNHYHEVPHFPIQPPVVPIQQPIPPQPVAAAAESQTAIALNNLTSQFASLSNKIEKTDLDLKVMIDKKLQGEVERQEKVLEKVFIDDEIRWKRQVEGLKSLVESVVGRESEQVRGVQREILEKIAVCFINIETAAGI